ncbi:MAG: transcriptional activator NhaR [Candidatus Anammoximicrobium sp.]|nr:transcriptional activator NhaR [Candidatus Anammoximicrobium sp.]
MDWVNYHHLMYFWVVAREGSVVRACEELQLSQPTISGQLAKFEKSLRCKLFRRVGRGLELTEEGRVLFRYADEIFTIGREMVEAMKGRTTGRPLRFAVGVVDVLPKLVVYRLLEPACRLEEPIELVCHEGKLDSLLGELALFNLDVVLSESPAGAQPRIRAFNHLLGSSDVSVYGTADLADRYRRGFPQSLADAPWLLPAAGTTLRRDLERWFDSLDMRPRIIGGFADSGLIKAFGQAGVGLFAGPTAIEAEVRRQFQVETVGRIEGVRFQCYAITVERRLKHPAVLAISKTARGTLFAAD